MALVAVTAQEQLNFQEADRKTYELFEQKRWEELIDFADHARKQGIEFFYLNARNGIAMYNLKKYHKSAAIFLKDWENGKSFDWYQEYLYYSLVFSGRSMEATNLAQEFSDSVKKKIGFSVKKLTRLALEGGYSFNPDFSRLASTSLKEIANTGENYGEAYYLRNYHFESIDLGQQVSPGIHLNHNFTYIGISREEQVDWSSFNAFDINISQFQYCLNSWFVIGKKWYVSPSVNLMFGKTNLWLGGLDFGSNNYFYKSPLSYSDAIFSGSAWSYFGNFSPGAELNAGTISDEGVIQFSAWTTWYPFSNVSFYLTPRVYFRAGSDNGSGYNTVGLSGGFQLGTIHFYGQYLNGEMKNFIEPGGYVVSNFPGRSTRKYMGSIYYPVGKKYQFVVRYLNQDVLENYQVYTNGLKSNNVEYKYVKHTVTGGISWYF